MRESLEIKEKIFNKYSIVYHYQIEIKPRVSEIERRLESGLMQHRYI